MFILFNIVNNITILMTVMFSIVYELYYLWSGEINNYLLFTHTVVCYIDLNRGDISPYRNVTMSLQNSGSLYWWELKEECNDSAYETVLRNLPYASCDNLVIYTFNDKSFPEGLNIISGKG